MKNLKTIQVISRIGLVLSRIKLVCSLVGFAMMIAALLCSHGAELTVNGGENGSIDNADVI